MYWSSGDGQNQVCSTLLMRCSHWNGSAGQFASALIVLSRWVTESRNQGIKDRPAKATERVLSFQLGTPPDLWLGSRHSTHVVWSDQLIFYPFPCRFRLRSWQADKLREVSTELPGARLFMRTASFQPRIVGYTDGRQGMVGQSLCNDPDHDRQLVTFCHSLRTSVFNSGNGHHLLWKSCKM